MKKKVSNDIFISYRRIGGDQTALLLKERLTRSGYTCFRDIDNLRAGTFNDKIFEYIDLCKDFIVILSPEALSDSAEHESWMHKEIRYALEKNKNIIPIMLENFEFPKEMPKDIAKLQYINAIKSNTELFEGFYIRLCSFLLSTPRKKTKKIAFTAIVSVIVITIIVTLFNIKDSPTLDNPVVSSGGIISNTITEVYSASGTINNETSPTSENISSTVDKFETNAPETSGTESNISEQTPAEIQTKPQTQSQASAQTLPPQSSSGNIQLKNPSEVGESEFSHNSNLQGTVIIPNTVKNIGKKAFYACDNIETIIIPEGCIEIGENAFAQCDNLSKVVFSSTVSSIGKRLLYGCPNLNEVNLEVTQIDKIPIECFSHCYYLKEIKIPGTITSIERRAFYANDKIETVTIPESCTEIGDEALGGDNLKVVYLPHNLTTIGENVFDKYDINFYCYSGSYADTFISQNYPNCTVYYR